MKLKYTSLLMALTVLSSCTSEVLQNPYLNLPNFIRGQTISSPKTDMGATPRADIANNLVYQGMPSTGSRITTRALLIQEFLDP